MSDIYSDSVYVQIKLLCKKRFPSPLTMVQVLYLLEVFTLAHYYGPPSTETPTIEATIVRCHKNS